MTPLRIVIVDDEPPARRKLRRLLERIPDTEVIGEAGSGSETLELFRNITPHLVLLDIQMPDMDGFTLLRELRPPPYLQVVFTTAYDQHALRAFEVQALDYLLKPVDFSRFERAVERARQRAALDRTPAHRLSLDTGEKIVFITPEQILFAEAARNYVLVHTATETHAIRSTLESFAAQLDTSTFPRINRSQLVNMCAVAELKPWFHGDFRARLEDGRELNWSRRYSPKSHLARTESR